MISEVANALLITYVATEYNIIASGLRGSDVQVVARRLAASNFIRASIVVTVLVSIVERYHVKYQAIFPVLYKFGKIPKIGFATFAYTVGLYWDCWRVTARSSEPMSVKEFIGRVGVAFLKVAPAYPFLAVIISFGFLFVVSAFEALHLNLELLNLPIYYGTLYGPFSLVYWNVKSRVISDYMHSLPINRRSDPIQT